MKRTRTVLIAPGHVAHYREKFYKLLFEHASAADVDLRVAASRALPSHLLPGTAEGVSEAPMRKAGPFTWQNTIRYSRGCDLVIAQQEAKYLANYVLQLKRLVSPQKFAFWGHGKNFQANTASLLAEYLKQRAAVHCDWWFAYNDRSAEVVADLGFPRGRITSVMNSIDTLRLAELKKQLKPKDLASLRAKTGIKTENVAVFTGGLYEQKRLRFLVDACELVRKKVHDFELVVIGSGPESPFMSLCAARNEWLHYVGPKTDEEKVPYWAVSKALLMPGLVGLVVLDSFALGVPLITTDYPDHSPEISYLKDGVNGIICSPWPSIQTYAERVTDFFLSPSLQNILSSNAEASAKDYTVEKMADNFFDGVVAALEAPKLRASREIKTTIYSTHHTASRATRLAVVTRSLSPYTRNFYDQIATERTRGTTTLIIGRRESDWINPWDANLLVPQVADHVYAKARTVSARRPILLPSRSLLVALERIRPSILAVQECSTFCVLSIIWALFRKVPFVLMTDVGDAYGPPYPPLTKSQKLVHKLVMRSAVGVIALSPDAEKRAVKGQKKYLLAPHAIDTAAYVPAVSQHDTSSPVILMTAGNFIYRKGYDLLIKALSTVDQRLGGKQRWIMRCYGSGETQDLRKLAIKECIGAKIEFYSFLNETELAKAYQNADVFVLASRKETYGVVLHEAAACGLPLVASTHAGATELLAQEGENAFCIDPENTAQFASALETIVVDMELRRRFGRKSREIAERWDVKLNARRTSRWIESLLV